MAAWHAVICCDNKINVLTNTIISMMTRFRRMIRLLTSVEYPHVQSINKNDINGLTFPKYFLSVVLIEKTLIICEKITGIP